jgi:signal transduction histidine kinase/ActR/RegA family two-component response regulator
MDSKRTFKKELPRAELVDVVLNYMHKISNEPNRVEIIKLMEMMSREVVTAEWARLWLKDEKKPLMYSESFETDKRMEIPMDKGLIGQCFSTIKPCFALLADEHEYYDPSVDNIENVPKKDILAIPVVDKKNEVVALLHVANSKDDLQQFTASDLDALSVIAKFTSNMIQLLQSGKLKHIDSGIIEEFDSELHETIKVLTREKKEAEAAVESSTRFLAEVAHEIRTPMNAVMGFLELLRVDETDEQKMLYLDTASKSGEMMVALVNDLLDFAKIEKGMMEIEAIDFSPVEEFASVGPLFCSRMKKSFIRFEVFIDPNMPKMVVSDPHRVKQILSNLIGNAIKFTPEDGVISLYIVYNASDKAIDFSVKDTGKGIAKEQQQQIFEAFKQETSATARQFGGTGLGLSISLKLAKLLGGTLDVESEEGKGSRFFFSVPLKENILDPEVFYDQSLIKKSRIGMLFSEKFEHESKLLQRYFSAFGIAKSNQTERKKWEGLKPGSFTHVFCSHDMIDMKIAQKLLDKGVPVVIVKDNPFKSYKDGLHGPVAEIPCPFDAIQLHKVLLLGKDILNDLDKASKPEKRVLVVDDNAINIQFMQAVGRRLGSIIQSASDGTDAVEIYKNAMKAGRPFDLIFMDENMPTMNGTEATQKIIEIEQKEKYPHTPIVGLSGNATEEQRTKSMDAGMDDCIFKPIGIKQITKIFDTFLKDD